MSTRQAIEYAIGADAEGMNAATLRGFNVAASHIDELRESVSSDIGELRLIVDRAVRTIVMSAIGVSVSTVGAAVAIIFFS
jgi:hypothetical protein